MVTAMKINELTTPIKTPTLVLKEKTAKRNLARMAEKARAQGVHLRPHFKTHQSALVGEWAREAGVERITVSSVEMARTFAGQGWHDILIAFPVNLREGAEINQLAGEIELGVLVESVESVRFLDEQLDNCAEAWIKVDTGMGRAGIWWQDIEGIIALAKALDSARRLRLRGLLTHAGQTYRASSPGEILSLYAESNTRMLAAHGALEAAGFSGLEISAGDTPGCWLSEDLGEVDEIRPGNFVFFDAMMHHLGVCRMEDIAVSVACPVVAKHAGDLEAVVYGGAVHLSKESITMNGHISYGYAALEDEGGWRFAGMDNYMRSLSQEHGIARLDAESFAELQICGLLYVIPAHVCLAVHALKSQFVILPD